MAKPVLLGRTDIQEGQIFFNGGSTSWSAEIISFHESGEDRSSAPISPLASRRDYDIEIGFHGTRTS